MRYILNVDERIRTSDEALNKQLWKLPVMIPFHGTFSEEAGAKFREQLEAAEDAALKIGQKIIPITIDSYGGSVYALLGMIDAIEQCSIPVATIVESKAMSCGAILFSCGAAGHRYIGPNATVMIHTVASGDFGKVDELKSSTAESDRLNEKVFGLLAKNCGHKDNYFIDQLKERKMADWFLTPQDCITHKLATKIHIPTIKVDVKYDFTID